MKRLIFIVALCGLLLSSAYGETISHTFSDGSKYVGEVKGGKMHGQGILTSSNGNIYEGKWVNGKYLNIKSFEKDANTTGESENAVKQKLLDKMD